MVNPFGAAAGGLFFALIEAAFPTILGVVRRSTRSRFQLVSSIVHPAQVMCQIHCLTTSEHQSKNEVGA
jgi:hypothetical protein